MAVRHGRAFVAVASAQLLACGPEAREHADLARVCGHEAPWRVLELPEDEAPLTFFSGVQRLGDRIYYIVGAAPHDGDPQNEDAEFWTTPVPEHTTLWSTGPCGESPRILAHDVWSVDADERWPDVVLARTGVTTGDILAIDPEGVVPPQVFLRDLHLLDAWTDHGVVSALPRQEDGIGTVRLSPYPSAVGEEPPEPITLRADVRAPYGNTKTVGDDVFTITSSGDLLAIDLAEETTSTLASGVVAFAVSSDGGFVGWQEPGAEGDLDALRATHLLDRDTGNQIDLGDARCCGLFFGREGMQIRLPEGGALSQRIVLVPSLEVMDVPTPLDLVYRTADDRWFGTGAGSELLLYDSETGDQQALFDDWGWWSAGPTSVDVLDFPSAIDSSSMRSEGALWRADYDADRPERIAERATFEYILDAQGRVITPLDVDEDFLGDLVVIDPESLDEMLIDDHVFAHLPSHYHPDPLFDDDAIGYTIVDGERSGVWLTRLPAPE